MDIYYLDNPLPFVMGYKDAYFMASPEYWDDVGVLCVDGVISVLRITRAACCTVTLCYGCMWTTQIYTELCGQRRMLG